MDRVTIPRLGIEVGRVALGTWSMGGWMWGDHPDRAAAEATLQRAYGLGIDLVDTAPAYGFGLSETLVGESLAAASDADKAVVATKCGMVWDERFRPWRDASPDSIRREVFESLERLSLEAIDLYQLHWPDPQTPLAETARAMCSLQEEGLVRGVGVCNLDAGQLAEFSAVCPISVCQLPYNLFQRDIEESALSALAAEGALLAAYSPLARGMLTGAMRPEAEPADEARRRGMFHGESFHRHLAVVDALDAWASEKHDAGVLQLAIRWILDGVDGSIVLWGARRPEQLDGYERVAGWRLSEDERAEVEAIVASGLRPGD